MCVQTAELCVVVAGYDMNVYPCGVCVEMSQYTLVCVQTAEQLCSYWVLRETVPMTYTCIYRGFSTRLVYLKHDV